MPGYPAVAPSDESVATAEMAMYTKYLDTLDAYKWPKRPPPRQRLSRLRSRQCHALEVPLSTDQLTAVVGDRPDNNQRGTLGEVHARNVSDESCQWALDDLAGGKRVRQGSPEFL